ncbi:MAG: hypothetical protein AABX00_03045 [Nanoarchaeota archaeon]
MKNKLNKKEIALFLTALIVASAAFYYFGPAITGFIIKEVSREINPGLVITSNGTYEMNLGDGSLKSLSLSGTLSKYGSAKVYLESGNERYLVFDSSNLDSTNETKGIINLITGFVAGNDKKENKTDDEEKKSKNSRPEWAGPEEFKVNGTAVINLSKYFIDADNDALAYSVSDEDEISLHLENGLLYAEAILNGSKKKSVALAASDGIAQTVHVIGIEVSMQQTSINHPPVWISGTESFILAGATSINLSEHFSDEDDDALGFSVSDEENIDEAIEDGILHLETNLSNANFTVEVSATDGNFAASKSIIIISPAPEENSISISLGYNTGTVYDANDNGEEAITGAVDVKADASFSWPVDYSKLCTKWELHNIDDDTLTRFCSGNSECCSLIDLIPSSDNWDDVYYSTFNKDGAGYKNTIYAQVISYDNGTNEVVNSAIENLSIIFYDDVISFEGRCEETCSIYGLNKSPYKLIFEVDGAILKIDSIKYNMLEDAANALPELVKNFSGINISSSSHARLNMSEYFMDSDGDELTYDYYRNSGVQVSFAGSIAAISPVSDFEGTMPMFITANDSENIVQSNIFTVFVLPPEFNLPTVNTANGSFEIRDRSDNQLAVFDSNGILNIKGVLLQDLDYTPGSNDFVIEGSGGYSAVITHPEGNLVIKGSMFENQNELAPTPKSFIISDKDQQPVAYFDSIGDLYLKGTFLGNVVFNQSVT